ncbi:MAG TPA: large conductance mechanosensitive channel protein MscL [Ruminiclostridium sp.]|nr:large conductance mechanosensitive channel protein MscL [Ruminiclostridium sp.]
MKGNVMDLAVGVIIGSAFGKIVTSLVADMIMPLLSLILGRFNIADASKVLVEQKGDNPAVLLRYGAFIQSIIDFLIIAFSIFLVIRLLGKFKRKKEEAVTEAVPEKNSQEAELLTEIRDLLKEKS